MKKNLIAMVAVMAAASVWALPSYVLVNTAGAKGETTEQSGYSAYYCTKTAAAAIFGEGNDTIATITAYLTKDEATYKKGMSDLASKGGVALDYYGFDDGEYSFVRDVETLETGDYLAILAYAGVGTDAKDSIRVFSSTAIDGVMHFDPAAGAGEAGAWTQVPEPTSGMLLLLGIAGLALKRKRA